MALKCARKCYKYIKWIAAISVLLFFTHLYIALRFFPAESDTYSNQPRTQRSSIARSDQGAVSARKYDGALADDEDFPDTKPRSDTAKKTASLRVQELDFEPACDVLSKEAVSAAHRANTQQCKRQIVDTACRIQAGNFYARELPNLCPHGDKEWGRPLGCYRDEKKQRLLASHYGNHGSSNTPQLCLDTCLQAGFPYAGVQYSTECFCGDTAPPQSARADDATCDMPCSGDSAQSCGGYFTMNIFETGLAKFTAYTPLTPDEGSERSVRVVFLLTLNGRALRQVHRLINTLYRSNHYFYIHVDARQHYLHRELSTLESEFPNIKLAKKRFASIWGGASLLDMLLASMKDLLALQWEWDFVINLSESDFPIKSLERLEEFLTANKGFNFVKSHGREVQRFIKKQGLDKTFLECDTHMWRIGDRKLPRGIVIDGGSDWIALSPDFVSYVVGEPDELLRGLHTVYKHTLLPAESFFHTALRNYKFCNTYVDNNLHVTNWKRKLGCKCQYKHIVDWCGCSPNDFRSEDWPRIQSTQDRQLFFARKFEPVINQEIIARVEQSIGFTDLYEVENIDAYWQNIYHVDDRPQSSDEALLSHARSITRHNARILKEEFCDVIPGEIVQISSYHYADTYKGNLVMYKTVIQNEQVLMETWYKSLTYLDVDKQSEYTDSIKTFKVGSEYDQKEQTFRNFGGILGPFSEPSLLYYFSLHNDLPSNLTVLWLDPAGVIADAEVININEHNYTNFVKPTLQTPLLPGVWRVGLFEKDNLIAQTKFLITPLESLSGKKLTLQEVSMIHGGSQLSYKNNLVFKNKHSRFVNSAEKDLLANLKETNGRRIDEDLVEWIDSLSKKFFKVLASCIHIVNSEVNKFTNCGKHQLEFCSSTKWSSAARDPKGRIGKLNNKTGRLDRV